MGSVTVALLAALLPTCIIILILVFICIFLFRESHRSQAMVKDEPPMIENGQSSSMKQEPSTVEQPDGQPEVEGAQISNPSQADTECTLTDFRKVKEDENRIREILERLHYDGGVSPAALCRYFDDPETRFQALIHVIAWVCHNISSISPKDFETKPQSGAHRFSAETLKALKAYRKFICGLSLSANAGKTFSKIPAIIVQEQDEAIERQFNEDVVKQVCEPVEELLWPYAEINHLIMPQFGRPTPYETNPLFRHFMFNRSNLQDYISNVVVVHIKLWASLQQFEIRWPQASDDFLSIEPELYIHASEDGTLLDSPKRVSTAESIRVIEDGSIVLTTPDGPTETVPPAPENGRYLKPSERYVWRQ